ncbi:DNA cytosine methyltransferase [Chelatococcus sambhunathii]|uniref:Cytosine-specific methyltransferase n=2 Tax=Chelatococcus sambhunathii TaxID=363953 RepID=A0ABU1DJG9_9HYPH|nr:DNA cytosine methyltransferase [Chelatococcus sambhunathii]
MSVLANTPTFFEFFAGAGMARAGLGDAWSCEFANDFDRKKSLTYQLNWGAPGVIRCRDIRSLDLSDLPGHPDLVWGSFPCQDLSLAGGGAGLRGERSGTFYPFWDLMSGLSREGRAPKIIALENVCGTLTSHKGADFNVICDTFNRGGYNYGAVVIDASLFVPQSRPRLFVIGVHSSISIASSLLAPGPNSQFHTRGLQNAVARLEKAGRSNWVWWNLPTPPLRSTSFSDVIEPNPVGVEWHTPAETQNLLEKMSPVNVAKVEAAKRAGRLMVGSVYKRTRGSNASKAVRAEVRFDDVAGCLRTPAGGSSRQLLLIVDGPSVRSRLISARETARLMGLPEHYKLPKGYNEAYHLTGDGVAVPVVSFLARHLFEPVLGICSSEHDNGRGIGPMHREHRA